MTNYLIFYAQVQRIYEYSTSYKAQTNTLGFLRFRYIGIIINRIIASIGIIMRFKE